MKKKVLLSSILTIALCLSLIGGSTFALFTSQAEVGAVITAGKLEVTAGVAINKLESVKGDENGAIVDENGAHYSYETVAPNFTNGGTATVANGVLTLEKVTPGDKVTFTLSGANNGNVAAQTRYIIECLDGFHLMSGLVITVNGGNEIPAVASYTSPWSPLAAETEMAPVTVTVELPVTAGNEFQGKSTSFRIVVEAVQGNAVVEDNREPVIEHVSAVADQADLDAALAGTEPAVITVVKDMALTVGDVTNKTFKVEGNDVAFTFNGLMENVVVEGIEAKTAGTKINLKNATGDITVLDSSLISAGGKHAGASIALGMNADLTVDNCVFVGGGAADYALSTSGSSGSVIITNSTFEGFTSWAILVNGTAGGDVLVDNCTFNTPDGVLKTLGGGVVGDFTFTNNEMIGCQGHDANPDKLVVSGSGTSPVICTGTKTVEGNTLDGAAWTQA